MPAVHRYSEGDKGGKVAILWKEVGKQVLQDCLGYDLTRKEEGYVW